ncbi:MAG TPA: GGDEF domain-containing protein [Marinospirillum sp.]|uniref:GGDEF domain-containing protein n=1 Tax=Marinospirillum sp. TaxID=2183934 RepID=UPI002B47FD83|nr:GGDEF domain-containing protein [Marinospirillum sp.]HKM14523.1 GGDEF domain-containing protein [Marinospirillum sp.]
MNNNDLITTDAISHQAITTILDSLDALVYVADIQTHELIFINEYGRKQWGEAAGHKCWQILQAGKTAACDFCTNHLLLNQQGESTGVQVVELQNTVNNQWYQCRDQAVRWIDGRMVRIEIATNITDRKLLEQKLRDARLQAELLADTDVLTGLNNRRAFFNLGKQLLHQAERNTTPVAILMFDLDFFKQINDKYGHATGDEVLIAIANIAKQQIRSSDVLARIGGEEFAVFMPQATFDQALTLAKCLKKAIAANQVIINKAVISCTASFGVSIMENGTKTLDALIAEADQALYVSKNGGRNLISMANKLI